MLRKIGINKSSFYSLVFISSLLYLQSESLSHFHFDDHEHTESNYCQVCHTSNSFEVNLNSDYSDFAVFTIFLYITFFISFIYQFNNYFISHPRSPPLLN